LIRKTIRRAINLVRFIYAHSSTLSLLRNRTNKMELVRYAITRFATSYLTLEMLHKKKANIRKIFISDEWILNKLSKEPKGKEVAKVVLMPSFWNSVVYTLKVMAPLVKVFVLWMVKGNQPWAIFMKQWTRQKKQLCKCPLLKSRVLLWQHWFGVWFWGHQWFVWLH